jgi:hypothetical protein
LDFRLAGMIYFLAGRGDSGEARKAGEWDGAANFDT